MFDFNPLQLIAGIPALLIAMVVHEYAHARVAVAMGDFTPRMMGRLTLNPKAHIDPMGLVMMFLVHFGWAKPVMVNPMNFRDPKKGDILVSLAGPGANLIVAFLAMFLLLLCLKIGVMSVGLSTVLTLIIIYNINFALFNLLPIPPLDGYHAMKHFLPREIAYRIAELERYSFLILLFIMMTPILGTVLVPLQHFIYRIFKGILSVVF